PAGSGVGARSVVGLTDAGRDAAHGAGSALPDKQRALLARLLAGDVPVAGMAKKDKPVLAALAEQGLAETRERRSTRVRLKRERVVQLAVPLARAREAVARSPKRFAVIDALASGEPVAISELSRQLANPATAIRELAKDGLVTAFDREVPLDAVAIGDAMTPGPPPELTAEQAVAVAELVGALGARSIDPATAVGEQAGTG